MGLSVRQCASDRLSTLSSGSDRTWVYNTTSKWTCSGILCLQWGFILTYSMVCWFDAQICAAYTAYKSPNKNKDESESTHRIPPLVQLAVQGPSSQSTPVLRQPGNLWPENILTQPIITIILIIMINYHHCHHRVSKVLSGYSDSCQATMDRLLISASLCTFLRIGKLKSLSNLPTTLLQKQASHFGGQGHLKTRSMHRDSQLSTARSCQLLAK